MRKFHQVIVKKWYPRRPSANEPDDESLTSSGSSDGGSLTDSGHRRPEGSSGVTTPGSPAGVSDATNAAPSSATDQVAPTTPAATIDSHVLAAMDGSFESTLEPDSIDG